jgi:lipopolysaccharide/colanic/teichoic acid biosynthesis glycosyltransferase
MDTRHNLKPIGLTSGQRFAKRTFDFCAALVGLLVTWWLILLAYVLAMIDTRKSGFFLQTRVGQHGKLFKLVKIRTMRDMPQVQTTVTTRTDPRITTLGRFWRRSKIDELPQLWHVLRGEMSFVGPRPDVPGFADQLQGDDRIILTVKPGITGPATLHFRDEESLLAQQDDPETYNREVIYPEKVRLNRAYVEEYRFGRDLRYIWCTLFG